MVPAYINSHLISPASLKYIIPATLQEGRELDPQNIKQILVPKHWAQRGRREPICPVPIAETFMASNVMVCQR